VAKAFVTRQFAVGFCGISSVNPSAMQAGFDSAMMAKAGKRGVCEKPPQTVILVITWL
jgi:hypothetical protein